MAGKPFHHSQLLSGKPEARGANPKGALVVIRAFEVAAPCALEQRHELVARVDPH